MDSYLFLNRFWSEAPGLPRRPRPPSFEYGAIRPSRLNGRLARVGPLPLLRFPPRKSPRFPPRKPRPLPRSMAFKVFFFAERIKIEIEVKAENERKKYRKWFSTLRNNFTFLRLNIDFIGLATRKCDLKYEWLFHNFWLEFMITTTSLKCLFFTFKCLIMLFKQSNKDFACQVHFLSLMHIRQRIIS